MTDRKERKKERKNECFDDEHGGDEEVDRKSVFVFNLYRTKPHNKPTPVLTHPSNFTFFEIKPSTFPLIWIYSFFTHHRSTFSTSLSRHLHSFQNTRNSLKESSSHEYSSAAQYLNVNSLTKTPVSLSSSTPHSEISRQPNKEIN
ncbi:hypothetical protein EYC84_008259 [Monilinia fructicola]|uniref:Uncharacterized protein n=1 Tax=Monilinia fructicola TaxID=38448 RepID=A0A5M9JJ00_MONFR|nr:hypothetical protein EYC84_008259 [Monilinia fructicola]